VIVRMGWGSPASLWLPAAGGTHSPSPQQGDGSLPDAELAPMHGSGLSTTSTGGGVDGAPMEDVAAAAAASYRRTLEERSATGTGGD
jgi:hypothetical protein